MLASDYDAVLDYERGQSNNRKVCHNRSKEDTLGLFRDPGQRLPGSCLLARCGRIEQPAGMEVELDEQLCLS